MNNRSKKLEALLVAWRELVRGYESQIDSIKKDQYLSPLGRTEKIKKLEAELERERETAVAMWAKEWAAINAEYVPMGKSETGERVAAMQTIIAVGKDMTPQMLEDILEPVRKDVSAVRLLTPVIEKQGLLEAFEGTKAYTLLRAANNMENCVKEAEKISKALEKEDDTLKWGISKAYMMQFLQVAERELEIVRQLEA